MEEGESGYCHHCKDCIAPLGCPVWCQVAGTEGKAVCRDCSGQWGRCLEAGLEMTEQLVCPGCQSGPKKVVGEVCGVFSPNPGCFSLCISLSLLCFPTLRQLTLPDGSEGTWVERAPCLEAGRGGPGDVMDPLLSPQT